MRTVPPSRQVGHAVIWPLPGDGEETQVRVFATWEAAGAWAGEHVRMDRWQYAAVVEDLADEAERGEA